MSNTIDQKVVEMRFDNKNFESNVSTSMSTLDKLKKALKFDGASKGLENINSAVKKCDMSSMSNGVQNVHAKFTALEVMAVTALSNITNRAMAAGEKLVKAFTLDPIKTGFQEYETQINAVQTILANTSHAGTDLQQVNAALDELNTYADKTIYNFTEMTRNIGTFTAAGVDLDTSVSAIKGIANLAAVSGSTSQQASTAMYQLSQALASGTVKLMDWNSVVNAGMGGKVFQDALIRTSELLKTGAKEAIAAEGSFRESLTKSGWLTTEVLTETLKQFAGAYSEADLISQGYTKSQAKAIAEMAKTATDAATKVKTFTQLIDTLKEATQSGWTQSWEIMIGDFEEAKVLFTELSDFFGDIINKTSETRNAMLEGAFSSPWEQLTKRIEATGLSVDDFQEALKKTATTHHASLDRMIREEGSLAAAIQSGRVKKEWVIETLKNLAGANSEAATSTEDMTKKLEQFQKVVDAVWAGDFGNGAERVKKLAEAGHDYAVVQDLVNKTVDGHKLTLKDLSDEQLKSMNLTDEQVKKLRELAEEAEKTGTPLNELIENMYKPSGRELMIDSLRNGLQAIVKVCSSVKEAWDNAFPPMTSGQLYKIIEAIHGFSEALVMSDDTANKLTRTLKGVFAIVDILTTIVGGTLKFGFKALAAILKGFNLDILDVTAGIGDMIVGFRDWIDENNFVIKGLESFAGAVKNSIPAIKSWYKEFMALPQVQQAITDFNVKCNELFNSITESAGNAWSKIKEFFKSLKDIDWRSLSVEDVKKMFADFGKTILSAIEDFTGPFDKLEEKLKVFKENASKYLKEFAKSAEENLSKVGGFFGDIYNKIKEVVTYITEKIDINWGAVFAIASGAAVIAFISKLGKVLDFISDFGDNGVLGLMGLGDVLESYQKKLKAQALKEQAIAIGILAASVAVLALLPFEDVRNAAVILVGLAGALALFAFTMSKIGDVGKISISMTTLAAALLILATSMHIIENLDPKTLESTVATLGVVALGLIAIAKLLSSKDAMKLPTGSMFLMAFSGSILMLVNALKKIEEADISASSIVELLAVMSGLALVTAAAKNVKASAALGLVASVIAIEILLNTIEKLVEFDGATLVEGLAKLIPIFVTYRLLMKSTKSAGDNAAKAGVAILAISASILILGKAIEMMADVNVGDIAKAIVAIGALEAMFAALIYMTKYAGPNATKAGAMLLMMSGALLILSGVIAVLTEIGKSDQGAMWNAVGAIAVIGAVFGAVTALTGLAKNCKATLITIGVVIGLLAVAIGGLAMIEKDNLQAATFALTSITGVFGLLIAATSLVQTGFKNISGVITTLGTVTIVVGLLAGVLAIMSGLDVKSSVENAEALSTLLLALSASMIILDQVNNVSTSAIGALHGVTAAVGLLAVIVGTLTKLDAAPSIDTATSLSILLGAMTGITLLLSAIGPAGTAALKGALILDAVIAVIGALIIGLGALVSKWDNAKVFIDEGLPMLEKIGYGITSFISGLGAGLSAGMPEIGENLSAFWDNSEEFFTGIGKVDSTAVEGAKAVADTLAVLTKASLISGITQFLHIDTSFETFGQQIKSFGRAMVEYSSIVSGSIDAEAVTASANAGKTLAELSNSLPSAEGTWAQWFNGKTSLETFSKQIQSFAKAIVGYSSIVSGAIDGDAIAASTNAGKTLAELSNSLPSAEGTLSYWFSGKMDLATFGTQIRAFAHAIVSYNSILSQNGGINEESILSSASAGKTLAELNNSLPAAEGTLAAWFSGKMDLSTFGTQIRAFAHAIVSYNNILMSGGGINEEAIMTSANAGKTLAELANSLPSSSGTLDHFFSGKIDMATFGENLKSFGLSFLTYSNHMKSVDANVVTATSNAATSLVTLANNLPTDKLFTNEVHLDEFGEELASFGKEFAEYYSHISGIVPATLSGVVTEIWRLLNLFTQMSTTNFDGASGFKNALNSLSNASIDEFVNTFYNAGKRVNDAISQLMTIAINAANTQKANLSTAFTGIMDGALNSIKNKHVEFQNMGIQTMLKFIGGVKQQDFATRNQYTTNLSNALTAIKNKYVDFESSGRTTMTKFIGGVKSNTTSLNSAFTSVLSSAITAINGYYSDFYSAGKNLALGFADGIGDYAYRAAQEAAEMAYAAVRAVENELDINSPSKVLYKDGVFAGQGFVNGLTTYVDKASVAGSEMANSTLSAVGNTIAKLSTLIEDGMDVTPTITPVLDLSEVEAETSRLNAMFSTNRAMNISSRMNARAASLNNQNEVQNGTTPVTSGNSYQFVQNNYSPKSLSRVEIYRQTNNQFSAFQRTVKA